MRNYLNVLDTVRHLGVHKGDRTGTGTQSHFGVQRRFSLANGKLPVVTTKKIHLHSVIHELIWMLSGDTKVDYLIANGVRIWNEWVKPETAVYQDLTYEETEKAILKFVGGKHHVTFHAMEDRPGIEIVHVNDYKERFNAEPPKMDEGVELILSVDTRSYGKYRDEVAHLDYSAQYMYIIHSMLIGKPQKLVGGDLGPVYGKTWRDIDDHRIIPKYEWVDYEARGFDFVIDIPGVSMETDRCLVTRKIDQIQEVIHLLKTSPDSRRIIVSAWDPRLVDDQALPPCHSFFQFWTRELTLEERVLELDRRVANEEASHLDEGIRTRGKPPFGSLEGYRRDLLLWHPAEKVNDDKFIRNRLDQANVPTRAISCQLYQRSVDTFLGLPFNIMFYGLLTHMLANQCHMVADEFIWTGGDTHIYSNHQEQVALQLTRQPKETPTVRFVNAAIGKDIREITPEDFVIENYEFHPHIAGKVAV